MAAAFVDRVARGGDGGDAIEATEPITIINKGAIFAGCGGGAGSGFMVVGNGDLSYMYPSACGGGGQGFYGGEASAPNLLADNNSRGRRGNTGNNGNATGLRTTWAGIPEGYSPMYSATSGRGGFVNKHGNRLEGDTNSLFRVDNNGNLRELLDGLSNRYTSGGRAGRAIVGSGNITWKRRGNIAGNEVA
jgi:hypothetical protein